MRSFLDAGRGISGAFRIQLAMSTATVASATVETASTAAVESIAAVEAAVVTAADEAVGFTAPVAVTTVTIISAMAVVAVAVVTAATVEAVAVVAAVEPRTGADEDAASEVVRPIVAVRSAGVRIVAVVAVSADWRRADGTVDGSDSNSNANLRVGAAHREKQNS
jgi:hypothetical protein